MLRRLTRIPGFRRLWHRFPLGSVPLRTEYDIWDRPNYAYGLYWSAFMASRLGMKRMSAIEFGVAGGSGLISLEGLAVEIGAHFGMTIDVFGFDTGEGMPQFTDYRDLPHVWRQGYWKMDRERLEARLRTAQLVIGNVADTVPKFIERADLAPVGFISFDLDYYSSTVDAFKLFSARPERLLPRVYCYFDDIIWPAWACHNDHTGELRAIREFNVQNDMRQLAPINGLRWMRKYPERWNDMIYAFHDFEHPHYTDLITPDAPEQRQLPLTV